MIELLEHNVETYQNLCKEMEKHNKVALIQATGTGKSYIISKYIEEHCHNALILVPANAIGDQWQKLLPNTEVKTYQAMAKGIEGEYDLIVADEMHHLGSDVWGQKFIEYFMQKPEQKVIGATATEIRYLDNARDMVEEIFNGIAVRGVDLATAIDKGILPTFKYVTAYYGSERDFDEYRNKINSIEDSQQRKDLSKRLEMCIQNQFSIKTAMYENLSMANHNIIVFLNGLCEIEKAIEMFKDMFPDCECNYVSSKRLSSENEISILRFQQSNRQISILLAVDMLNEGVHIKGADTVVMFRNTESPQIYFQQMGRVLDANGILDRVIFDFACNAINIKANHPINKETPIIYGINNNIRNKQKKIILKSYTKDIEILLTEIKERLSPRFTQEEREYIEKNTHLTAGEIARALNKSTQSIRQYAEYHGITLKIKNKTFSAKEDEFILQHHSDMTATEVAKILGRHRRVVVNRAQKLGVPFKNVNKLMSTEHKEYITANYKDMTISEMSKNLGITFGAVSNFCANAGLQPKKGVVKLTDSEKKYIRENTDRTAEEIAQILNRSGSTIRVNARKMGIKLGIEEQKAI